MTVADRDRYPISRPDAVVAAVADRQFGVVAHAQARGAGMSDAAISRRVDAELWERLLPRVYRVVGATKSGQQDCMAACLWAGPEAVTSHRSAGVMWGLDGIASERVEITVPYGIDVRSPRVVVHRAFQFLDCDRAQHDGVPVSTVVRTLVDLAGVVPVGRLELAIEDALRRRLTTPDDLDYQLWRLGGRGRRGTANLRRLLAERGSTSDSGWEVRLRRLLIDHGLPAPEPQHEIVVAGRRFRLDLAYPPERVGIEFDSLRWHTGRDRLESDAARRNLLHQAGWNIVHVTAGAVRNGPEQVVGHVRHALRASLGRDVRAPEATSQ